MDVFRTRDFRISHIQCYESGAVVPLSGSDQAEPPRQDKPREHLRLKAFLTNH